MRHLLQAPPNSDWSDFAKRLADDFSVLGWSLSSDNNARTELEIPCEESVAADDLDRIWDRAHHLRQKAILLENEAPIREFERDFDEFFVASDDFDPRRIRPVLEVVDWTNPVHTKIINYLKLYQCVVPGKTVGRRMAILVKDVGQSSEKLIGAALLSSPRFSQKVRDSRLGWAPDYPKTSANHCPKARAIRLAGLARTMQLSMACALPPYSILSCAWLIAMVPFTETGLQAFRSSVRGNGIESDLAAVFTTSGKSKSAQPFRGHRLNQLAPSVPAASGSKGALFQRVKMPGSSMRASFESMVSQGTKDLASHLFRTEHPDRFEKLNDPVPTAMAFAIQRLGLSKDVYLANKMGVHIGALGSQTLDHLREGTQRPLNERYILEWDQIVDVWRKKTIGPLRTDEAGEVNQPQLRKIYAATNFPPERIRLSSNLELRDPSDRPRIADLID